MESANLNLDQTDIHKLLCAANGDAALLYLYIKSGNDPDQAESSLRMSDSRMACAAAALRQLGLWENDRKTVVFSGERPRYTESDVLRATESDNDFSSLCEEVQRTLGRPLNTEELKIILGFVRYLGLPADVISVLVCYCKEKARERGSTRNPSLRSIEKEAYRWAEQGIDTMEEAAVYMQAQSLRRSRMGKLMQVLQIRGRNLTPAEERYAQNWVDMGFDDDAIAIAYERTCLNTGGLSWAYMNKILLRWQENGMFTAEQIRSGDRKPAPKGAAGQLGDAELEAIRQTMKEG